MKILICIPHFFAVSHSKHGLQGSSQDSRNDRARSVEFCLTQILSMIRGYKALIGTKSDLVPVIGNTDVDVSDDPISGSVVVCTYGNNHILDMLNVSGFRNQPTHGSNPRLLGYACRWIFEQSKDNYDLFMYIEDDTAVMDPEFLNKVIAFYKNFGDRRVVLPHRYEIFSRLAVKTYLDQPAPPFFRRKPDFQDEHQLRMSSYNGDIIFEQTPDYSTGCYVITREQLEFWISQKDFHMPQPSIHMDELEQAGGALGGHFPIYKPALTNASFLEVHHVPNKACNAKTPRDLLVKALQNRIDD